MNYRKDAEATALWVLDPETETSWSARVKLANQCADRKRLELSIENFREWQYWFRLTLHNGKTVQQ